jgi:hypothetical protein
MRTKQKEKAKAPAPRPLQAPKAGGRRTFSTADWIWIAAIVLVYVLLRIHSVGIPLDRDEGMFGYAGQRILEGGLPYRDAIDQKPPGSFYIYALALKFVPPTAAGVHLFLHFYNFLTLVAVTLLMWVRFRSRPAWVGGAFCFAVFSASPAIQGFTASTEMLTILPVTVCLLLTVAAKRFSQPLLLVASGIAGAVALATKQQAATAIGFAVLYLLAYRWLEDRPQGETSIWNVVRDVLLWSAGAAGTIAGIVGYFYLSGIFHDFIYWTFTHSVAYARQITFSETLSLVKHALLEILRGDFAVVLLGPIAAVVMLRKRTADSLFVLGFLVFSLIGTLPGYAYAHYFALLAPAVAVGAGWALSLLHRKGGFGGAFYAAALALLLIPIVVHSDYFIDLSPEAFSRRFFGLNPFPESIELSAYLAAHTIKQDPVFMFGSETQILFEASRKSSTPFAMIYPLTRDYPRAHEFQESVWQDILRNRPVYILFVNIGTSILWDGKVKMELYDRMNASLKTDYDLEAVMPVRQTTGQLVLVNNGQVPEELTKNQNNIYVYRRKMGS